MLFSQTGLFYCLIICKYRDLKFSLRTTVYYFLLHDMIYLYIIHLYIMYDIFIYDICGKCLASTHICPRSWAAKGGGGCCLSQSPPASRRQHILTGTAPYICKWEIIQLYIIYYMLHCYILYLVIRYFVW